MLWPLGGGDLSPISQFLPWQVLTYAFMHGSFAHLLFNMLALLMFGAPLEHTWGERRFLTYFLVCVLGAAACQLAVGAGTMAQGGGGFPPRGAPGGGFGLLPD